MGFEFRRQGRVWLEYLGSYYLLHTTREVTFSQTFKQNSPTTRTLHSLNNLFDGSVINEANPADFSFELYLINDDGSPIHQHLPLDLLLGYNGNLLNSFNLYFVFSDYSPEVYYKVENCVFTNGTFNIPRVGIMSVTLQGQGSKLTRTVGAFLGIDSGYSQNPEITVSEDILVTVGAEVLTNILGVSLEVSNEISWTANNTLQKSLAVTNAANSIFPDKYTIQNRKLSGSIQQYIGNSNSSQNNLQTWQENITVRIQAGNIPALLLDINLVDGCSFTNRLNMGELFTQNYDFRLITNPADLLTYFTY